MCTRPHLLARLVREDDGAVAVYVALIMPILLGIAALIELGVMQTTRVVLQTTADAAALAGASQLPSVTDVESEALAIAALNMPAAKHGTVLTAGDVETGNWDSTLRIFTTNGMPMNAVRVTARRSESNGNAFPFAFGTVLGGTTADVTASAVAWPQPGLCSQSGLIGSGRVTINSNNSLTDGFCLHGEAGVTVNSNNYFEAGTEVSMKSLKNLVKNNNNDGLTDALAERSLQPTAAIQVKSILDALKAGTGKVPFYLNPNPVTVNQLPNNPVAGTLYYVTGGVAINSGKNLQNIGIIANGDININSNNTLQHVLLASYSNININSNTVMGGDNFCSTNKPTYVFARYGVTFNSNTDIRGTQIIAGSNLIFNSNNRDYLGVVGQSNGNITMNSNVQLRGCDNGNSPTMHSASDVRLQLVD